MKLNFKQLILSASILYLFANCTNDSVSDLIDTTPIPENVTFNQNVKAIMTNNCTSCHGATPSNGAPMPLITIEDVKDAILNRDLINRITRENGDGLLMPEGGPKLPQNRIDAIIQWQLDGFQE
jgi:hypothetical protein